MKETSDSQTTLSELRNIVEEFVCERHWQQFHTPKNISMSLAVEAAELMEHFQWSTPEESSSLTAEKKAEVGEEMADVFCYLLAMANQLDLDLSSSLKNKMVKNRLKYPVDEYRGRFGAGDHRPVADA